MSDQSVTPPANPATPQQQQIQVNVDYLKTTRVHICMPCYGGQLTESTFMSYIKWANAARQLGLDWTVETMTNESLISRARNTLFVFAAGNGDQFGRGYDIDRQPTYPAAYGLANIVTVAASDSRDRLGSFSNFGVKNVQLAAPGVNIVSALPMKATAEMEQYKIPTAAGPLDGTSMATPYVAGAATMLLSANPRMQISEVKSRLLGSVDKISSLAGKVQSGGRLNLAKLMGVSR